MTSLKTLQVLALSVGMIVGGTTPTFSCGDGSCEPPAVKGNNGWGQEKNKGTTDGTNAGSDNGGTADTKFPSTQR